MKTTRIVLAIMLCASFVHAQQSEIIPDLTKVNDTTLWHLDDRELINVNLVHLSAGSYG